jgi:hypothetical protein
MLGENPLAHIGTLLLVEQLADGWMIGKDLRWPHSSTAACQWRPLLAARSAAW